MGDLKKITELREIVEDVKRKASKAEGALERVLAELKEEFNCDSLEDAESLLVTLKKDLEYDEAKSSRLLKIFETKWGDVLNDPE